VKEQQDLFVIHARIAADHDRARRESLGRAARAGHPARGPRAWLGRRLVAVGLALAGDTRVETAPSTRRSH